MAECKPEKKEHEETARVEHCRACKSTRMKNNIFFPHGGGDVKIYVQCADCGEYVARYIISGYTSERRYESCLHSLRFDCHASGARTMRKINAFAEKFEREYQHVLDLIREAEDQRDIEQIIEDDYDES